MSTTRLEAFSDGVIAIAITLLVLEIHVPAPEAPGSLASKLAGHLALAICGLVAVFYAMPSRTSDPTARPKA